MDSRGLQLLRFSFLIGVIADALVAVNWFLIASGFAQASDGRGASA
jgi:hypothetical protein